MDLREARQLLELGENTEKEEVRGNYRRLAKEYHPDLNSGNSGKMMEINEAYEIIMKGEFDIIGPWQDYQEWWLKQYGNDPIWGAEIP
ncbi:DnaJ domain-containing protein [Candidatus Woesearchaeota archaeon]|nr:DnaJ domain-containing protein [Candidatus Woesearchaeota archaeon]